MSEFLLHPQLAADCHVIADLELSRLLLMNDCRYPWVIMVPMRQDIRELYQLSTVDRTRFMSESCKVAEILMQFPGVEKLNVAALGNIVPQLHIHHVGRHVGDPAWPAQVWGHSKAEPYSEAALQQSLGWFRQKI